MPFSTLFPCTPLKYHFSLETARSPRTSPRRKKHVIIAGGSIVPVFPSQDVADILIMSFLVYQLYRWFKNTKALQVVIGIGFLVVLYFVTKNLDLFMTSWILQQLGTVLFILIIVIFQTEIRQALYRFSLPEKPVWPSIERLAA